MSRIASCLAAAWLVLVTAAAAQPRLPRVEAWGGITFVSPALAAAVPTSYTPLIEHYDAPLAGTTAGQTVRLEGGAARGLGGGLSLFFSEHLGVQFLADTDRFHVSGTNGEYSFLLNYTAKQPPDYVSRQYSYSRTFTACDAAAAWGCVRPTTGRIRQTSVGAGLVGRWRVGRNLQLEASGGASYVEMRGDAEALRYTAFQMGGHSTLWSNEYQLAYSIGAARGVRLNLGASLDVLLRPGLALAIDGRYLAGPDLPAAIAVTGTLNQDELMSPQPAETIQRTLEPPAAPISPSRIRVLLGLKLLL